MGYKGSYDLFDRIKGIKFKKGDSTITPKEVFDNIYSSLDGLLRYNRRVCTLSRSIIGEMPDRLSEETQKDYFKQWIGRLPEDISAIIELCEDEHTSVKEIKVKPRTNFALTRGRRPSILYLEDDTGIPLILRAARTYKPEDVALFGNYRHKIDKQWYTELMNNRLKTKNLNTLLFIPEPFLLGGLETMYMQGAERITPSFKVVGLNGNDLYYIRQFLNRVSDLSFDNKMASLFGCYLGNLYSYGLLEGYDRQAEQYALNIKATDHEKPKLVNYDPDFYLYMTKWSEGFLGDDWKGFKNLMNQFSTPITDDILKIISDTKNSIISEEMAKGCPNKRLLFDSIKPRLEDYDILKKMYIMS